MASDFNFSLLENGLDFLLSSLDHLTAASALPTSPPKKASSLVQAANQKRHLKYALLHLCSSIELIFKERLRQEHWSLVFADTNKANKDDYDLGDFQSVAFQAAQDRLIGICEIEFGPFRLGPQTNRSGSPIVNRYATQTWLLEKVIIERICERVFVLETSSSCV